MGEHNQHFKRRKKSMNIIEFSILGIFLVLGVTVLLLLIALFLEEDK